MFFLFIILSIFNVQAETINVGVEVSYPYAYKDIQNNWTGISVDLWNEISLQNRWTTNYINVPFGFHIKELKEGNIDVYIPNITLTEKREKSWDFSYPYYKDWLAIANHEQKMNIGTYIKNVCSVVFKSFGYLGIVLVIIATIYWYFEKSHELTFRNWFDSIYWAMTTAATVGYGDEAPKSIGGRIAAMIWMFCGIGYFGYLITQITSITLSDIQEESIVSRDIPNNIIVIDGTTSQGVVQILGKKYTTVNNQEELINAYNNGNTILYDESVLKGILRDSNIIRVVDTQQYYSFMFPEESKWIEQTNQKLLNILNSQKWEIIKKTHE